jgi:hypothetical protein
VISIDKRILDLENPSQEVIASDQKRLVVDEPARPHAGLSCAAIHQRAATVPVVVLTVMMAIAKDRFAAAVIEI